MARNRPLAATATNGVSPVESIESQANKNRPKDTRLRQQRLPAWQPILTAKTVIPIFLVISILFIPIGIVLLITNARVNEYSIYYDEPCERSIGGIDEVCTLDIILAEDFKGDVYFYYGLENYFQNHRRYMRSKNDFQFLGKLEFVDECAPFALDDNGTKIAPCGAIANSMFNDTFELYDATGQQIKWTHEELVLPIDRDKFRNPKVKEGDYEREPANIMELCAEFENYAKPPNWAKKPCMLDENVNNSGFQNADFIIWMRTAAFPDFRKPYRKLISSEHTDGLQKGIYKLKITYNYNVSSFSGRKSFIISTTSWMGGKNQFLGIAYIIVGTLCAIIGLIFIVIHLKYGHSLQEMAGMNRPGSVRQSRDAHHQ